MWEVVVWLSVLSVTEAFKEPFIEYRYSRKDGKVLIEPISKPELGSYARNKTIYVTNDDPVVLQNESMQYLRQLSQSLQPRFLRWTSGSYLRPPHNQSGRFLGQNKLKRQKGLQAQKRLQSQQKLQRQKKSSYSNIDFGSTKLKLSGHDIRKHPQLVKLQKFVKPDEVETCTEGATIYRGCNHCLCMGGQLYICTARVCEPGDMNTLTAFEMDTNCIEGELIRSFDVCNRCYCGGGKILCTRNNCHGHGNERMQECTPGSKIPSPDNCNFCACNNRGFIVCTTNTCGPEISSNVEDMGCKPDTWFSLERHSRCKECYCVNGKMAFCYVNLCIAKTASLSFKSKQQHLDLPGALPDHCNVNSYMQDKYTQCYCTSTALWSCNTREIGTYDRNTPPSQTTDEPDHTRTRRRNKTTRTPSQTTDEPDHTTTRRRNKTTRTPSQTIDEPDHTTTRRRHKTTATPTQTTDDSDYTSEVNHHPFANYDGAHVVGPETESVPEFLPKPDGNEYDSAPTVNEYPNGISTNIDKGPFCTEGQFFTQGSDTHCQGCFCTINNEWKCYSIKGSCREYSEKTCNPGKLKKPNKPCSICYCGNDKKSYCATDETCSLSIKPSSCDPISCLNHCMGEGAGFGVCHRSGCICVN